MNSPPVIDTTTAARTNTFPRQLKFWGIHCTLTALPSFCIALLAFNKPPAIAAMLCGIATFVFGYAFITSTALYGKVHTGLIGRSIKLGTRIRMIISLVSLPLLVTIIGKDADTVGDSASAVFFVPDFWFGYAALIICGIALNILAPRGYGGLNIEDGLAEDFLLPYLTTIVEGILISVSLVMVAFITLIILNFRKNSQQMPSQHFPQGPSNPT